jgi:hypothetical protein
MNAETFVPTADVDGNYRKWGIDNSVGDGDEMLAMIRRMTMNALRFSGGPEPPEVVLVKKLMKKKEAAIEAAKPQRELLYSCDLIIEIDLDFVSLLQPEDEPSDHRVFRKISCSGGITLRALQDRILVPAICYVRNYHGYVFEDLSDGAVFGNEDSGAIDLMHLPTHGYHGLMDDRKVKLADILHTPGALMGWTYDLGDHWRHIIKLIEIVPKEKSTGKCIVLDGCGNAPPEDSNGIKGMGTNNYITFLDKLEAEKEKGGSEYNRLLRHFKASCAVNYQNMAFHDHNDTKSIVADAQQRIQEALRSPASVAEGSKLFSFPMVPGGATVGQQAGRGQTVTETPFGGGMEFARGMFAPRMVETVSDGTRKDRREDSVCAFCGASEDLKVCAGCKVVRFCSRECQAEAWKAWHKKECKKIQASRSG